MTLTRSEPFPSICTFQYAQSYSNSLIRVRLYNLVSWVAYLIGLGDEYFREFTNLCGPECWVLFVLR